ncbi:MAG TPA: cobalamin-binding protein [Dehalococcoidia bacterium]|nr:cobalamin-binding protein [Dehalococcoidia bacterium]
MTSTQRIVSLLPSATEILFAIGAGERVVAVTHECDHPPDVAALPRVTRNVLPTTGARSADIDRHIRRVRHHGSGIYALDEALLAELQPDLIVTQELCDVCAVAYSEVCSAVRRLGADVPVMSLEPRGLEDIARTMVALGEVCDVAEQGRAAARCFRNRIAAAATPLAGPLPRVVCIEWTDPLMAGGHWVPEMVEAAGGVDVLGRRGEPSHQVAWDEVLAAAPDALVLMPCGFDLGETLRRTPEVTSRPGFAKLPCAKTGRVVAVDGSAYFNRPGPRIATGVELLAAALRAGPGGALPEGAAWVTA